MNATVRTLLSSLFAICAAALTAPTQANAACTAGSFCAGAASVDMTWHVGSGQGQYGSAGNGLTADRFDPFHHQTKMVPSHGMQSRLYTKALVVQGPDGTKAAVVKVDVYLQQDVLTRRVAELVSGGDPVVQQYVVPGLDGSKIILGATHNHSAPEYASTAWGVWLFTDTIDFRMFETTARKIAQAIKEAADALEPAKMGATVLRYADVQQNILGPGRADDGTPAGFPRDHFDDELAVVRFETLPGEPIAAWVTLGMHPESLQGSDFVSSDFTGMVEREIERGLGRTPDSEEGPVVVWIQGSVGDVEPDKDGRAHPQIEDRHYWHRDFAQAERMSRDLSQAVLDAWNDVVTETDLRRVPEKHISLSTGHPVAMVDYHFSGPPTHPVGTVSNCRTLHPGAPIIGLPNCERGDFEPPEQYGTTIELLQDAGIPVPDNYSSPSYGAVQEELRIHLQALRIGEVVAGTMPGEPISDMVKNFKSRTDSKSDEMYLGYEWDCDPNASTCDFRTAGYRDPNVQSVDPDALELMYAQIRNDAAGWEDDLASLQGESEAQNPDDIYGNFTHEEIQDLDCGGNPCSGYTLPLGLGQTNDYIGYIVTYREYMSHDHYRKALTPFGPHTADYINTRLVRMAAQLKGSDVTVDATLDPVVGPADEVLNTAKALAAGSAGGGLLAASEAALPDDGGTPGPTVQPDHLERFDGARFSWIGGSNWTDNPEVVVQRLTGADPDDDASWTTTATQEGGEVVLRLKYDSPFSAAPMDWLLGNKTYEWTAVWEAFETTVPGTYRFLVNGRHRRDRTANAYTLPSQPFGVDVWRGIRVTNADLTGDTLTFRAAGVEADGGTLETDADAVLDPDEIHYPDSYDAGDSPYIEVAYDTSHAPHVYCYRCTWRAWADTAKLVAATVEIDGEPTAASFDPSTGTFTLSGIPTDATVTIPAGGVLDEHGNTNGETVEVRS